MERGGDLRLELVTIANGAAESGGGTVTVRDSTFSGNSAPWRRGGISNDAAVTIKNSIVGNSPEGEDCENWSSLRVEGVNFATDGSCAGFTVVTSDELNLGLLTDNGGPTQTHALLEGSVAIDAVRDCTDLEGNAVETDQRGAARPYGSAYDVSAFEAGSVPPTPSVTPTPTPGAAETASRTPTPPLT